MISFNSEVDNFSLDRHEFYSDWLHNVAKVHFKEIEELSVTFLTDDELLAMNNEFLMHDEYTDILTFDLSIPSSGLIIGDIYISIDRVKENADLFNVTFYAELARVMVHGLLHLIGFKDKEQEEKSIMQFQENIALDMLMH